jgi:hypothetical protein
MTLRELLADTGDVQRRASALTRRIREEKPIKDGPKALRVLATLERIERECQRISFILDIRPERVEFPGEDAA